MFQMKFCGGAISSRGVPPTRLRRHLSGRGQHCSALPDRDELLRFEKGVDGTLALSIPQAETKAISAFNPSRLCGGPCINNAAGARRNTTALSGWPTEPAA